MNDIFVVPLTNSDLVCVIYKDDWNKIKNFPWRLARNQIATSGKGERKYISIAKLLTGKFYIDHKDRNFLNNLRDNYREANPQKNIFNSTKRRGCASQYKGVSKMRNKWRARLVKYGIVYYLGVFPSEQEAVKAYDTAVTKYFGEFGVLNFHE